MAEKDVEDGVVVKIYSVAAGARAGLTAMDFVSVKPQCPACTFGVDDASAIFAARRNPP